MKGFLPLILLFNISILHAQHKFKAGVLAGLATSQVHGDTYSGFDKAGYLIGGFVKRDLSEKWDVKFEINILQKGSKKNPNPEKGDYRYYLLKLNYIEVPLMIRAHQKKWIGEAGFAFATLFKTKEYNEFGEITGIRPFNKNDYSVLIGIGYAFNEKVEMNIRYTNSFKTIREYGNGIRFNYNSWFYNLFNKGYYNNLLSFALHYQI